MKIALISNSLLLTKSLEIYLRHYLTSYKMCDFVVATEPIKIDKPVFLIGDFSEANLNKPFTKEMLLEELEAFYWQINRQGDLQQESSLNNAKNIPDLFNNFKELKSITKEKDAQLQQKIQEVLKRYTEEIVNLSVEYLKGKNG